MFSILHDEAILRQRQYRVKRSYILVYIPWIYWYFSVCCSAKL